MIFNTDLAFRSEFLEYKYFYSRYNESEIIKSCDTARNEKYFSVDK